jgi:hypothetical protein
MGGVKNQEVNFFPKKGFCQVHSAPITFLVIHGEHIASAKMSPWYDLPW